MCVSVRANERETDLASPYSRERYFDVMTCVGGRERGREVVQLKTNYQNYSFYGINTISFFPKNPLKFNFCK